MIAINFSSYYDERNEPTAEDEARKDILASNFLADVRCILKYGKGRVYNGYSYIKK